jgi:hypothetical protein
LASKETLLKIANKPLLAGFLLALTLPFAANADLPGKHPAYLHALTDLRAARWMVEHRPGDAAVSAQEDLAVAEIGDPRDQEGSHRRWEEHSGSSLGRCSQ